MKDRIPTYPGRIKLTPVAGSTNLYDMERADDPTQVGTPLDKVTFLTDATAEALGLNTEDPTVNEALAALLTAINQEAATVVPIAKGGTGQTTAPKAVNALVAGLTALASTGLADGDYIPLQDVSASLGKKITLANLISFIAPQVATSPEFEVGHGSSGPDRKITLPSAHFVVGVMYNNRDMVTHGFFFCFRGGGVYITDSKWFFTDYTLSSNGNTLTIPYFNSSSYISDFIYVFPGNTATQSVSALSDLQQQLTEQELNAIEQGQSITDLELKSLGG